MRDSNSRPLGPKPSALAIWANSRERMVGVGGLEPPTSPLSEVRSNRLSYTPIIILNYLVVPRGRIELPTQGFSGLCSTTELPWHKKIARIFIRNYSLNAREFSKINNQKFQYFFCGNILISNMSQHLKYAPH